jgi:Fungal specific transcription factor domain
MYRGGPRTTDYLSRFFSLLDVSGSLFAGGGPLIEGNYWLEDAPLPDGSRSAGGIRNWPAYDPEGVCHKLTLGVSPANNTQDNENHFHILMTFMARMSRLSAAALEEDADQIRVRVVAAEIRADLNRWWLSCPVELRDKSNDWRQEVREEKLTVSQTLQEEGMSSIRSCMFGCIIYLNHILNPVFREPRSPEVTEAIREIIEIARETPEGYGLEMGLYFGLFMAGIAVFNEPDEEELLRRKLKADTRVSIYVRIPYLH